MKTPIYDFVRDYAESGVSRLHMPGHKGKGLLGCEPMDITEVAGADELYDPHGIIAQSEANATAIFGTGRTLYSTEGSSQCIRAMLFLARTRTGSDRVVAARNVHKSFVYAAGLLDLHPVWLWPEAGESLCSCPIMPQSLERVLSALPQPPCAVYITSPDYLGAMQDVAALARVCHAHGTLLLVDNAHGAYLRFLGLHPMELGADLCCDSAHKTLPVLTGGAYLHLAKHLPQAYFDGARQAMALFGSTSPSYLILASLDRCNAELSDGYGERLVETARCLAEFRRTLDWPVLEGEPLKLTLRCTQAGYSGTETAALLRREKLECEFADPDHLVCMLTPENDLGELERLKKALPPVKAPISAPALPPLRPQAVCSIRKALFTPQRAVPADEALGAVCGAPAVSCPPAVPPLVSGERVDEAALAWLRYYGLESLNVCL